MPDIARGHTAVHRYTKYNLLSTTSMAALMELLKTVCYTLTAPWQNWKVAIHQILLIPEHSPDRVTTMTLWRKNRKTEYSTVTIVVSCHPPGNIAYPEFELRREPFWHP